MKIKTTFLILSIRLIFSQIIFADSPLTSTPFHEAYKSDSIIIKAAAGGILKGELTVYLLCEDNPIGIKMALINRLGWKYGNKDNSLSFFNYLKKTKGYKDKSDFKKRGKDSELLCYAYLKAMDNYFEVDEASGFASIAFEKNPDSYTFSIINALIKAQIKLNEFDWCEVYNLTNRVRENKSLNKDMDAEAADVIFAYMDQYREYCKPQKNER